MVLEVGLKLAKLLEKEGANVIITRDDDYLVNLYDRPQMANNLNADIFVSIHVNAASNQNARGTETYYSLTPKSQLSAILAEKLQEVVINSLQTEDRGIKQANFVVIREANMAAALVELAFVSNSEDEAMLRNPDFLNQAATALLQGIKAYFKQKEMEIQL